MSPGRRGKKDGKRPSAPARGSGPGGRIEVADIRSKLEQIRGQVDDTTDTVRPYLTYVVVAGAVVVIAVVFLAGSRVGRRRSTWVEVKRR